MTAWEMKIKLELLDKNVEFHDDPNIIIPISNRIKRSNLIIFSLNGETYSLFNSGQIILKNRVSTITITTNNRGKLIN